jgi:hypothetical protein
MGKGGTWLTCRGRPVQVKGGSGTDGVWYLGYWRTEQRHRTGKILEDDGEFRKMRRVVQGG